jgi:hypothetical protein
MLRILINGGRKQQQKWIYFVAFVAVYINYVHLIFKTTEPISIKFGILGFALKVIGRI